MDHADRLLHRAYVLVESEVPATEAIEDLVTLAQGNVAYLEAARGLAHPGAETDQSALELAGFDADLGVVASRRRRDLADLLDRSIASFG